MKSGQTPIRHLRALLDADPHVALVQWSGKRIVRRPAKDGTMRLFTTSEDLLNGCFDALAIRDDGRPWAIQATTWGSSAPYQRMRKVERHYFASFARPPARPPFRVFVVAWEARKAFRVWEAKLVAEALHEGGGVMPLTRPTVKWHALEPWSSPLLRSANAHPPEV